MPKFKTISQPAHHAKTAAAAAAVEISRQTHWLALECKPTLNDLVHTTQITLVHLILVAHFLLATLANKQQSEAIRTEPGGRLASKQKLGLLLHILLLFMRQLEPAGHVLPGRVSPVGDLKREGVASRPLVRQKHLPSPAPPCNCSSNKLPAPSAPPITSRTHCSLNLPTQGLRRKRYGSPFVPLPILNSIYFENLQLTTNINS